MDTTREEAGMKRVLLLASQRFSSRPGYFEVDWLGNLDTHPALC